MWNRRFLTPVFILIGLCLLGLGLAWSQLMPPSAYWSPQQATEYNAAQLEMHTKSHQHTADTQNDMALARQRFERINQQLERARSSQGRAGALILAAGILALAVGIVLHVSAGRSD